MPPRQPGKPKRAAPPISDCPTEAELARAYTYLLAACELEGARGANLLFYEACFSNDAELERAFEGWADDQDNPLRLPLDLLEDDFATKGQFAALHGYLTRFTPAQLARAVPLMRAFLADPNHARYRTAHE